jgi:TonB-linked SusC/RagA family outer membrane protein
MKVSTLVKNIFFAALLSIPVCSMAQAPRVDGIVKDVSGQPLAGVSIQIKGANEASTSKRDGTFSIALRPAASILIFSYVGMATQEVPIKNGLTVIMVPEEKSLQTIVVVGYGTQRKSDVTGALTSISAKTLEERPVTNALQAVQGKAAGVNVFTNIKPGETPNVRIRGNRSITASNDPLYVVDGIPIVSALGVTSFSLNDINPNDIASMEILKDASATAIYGSRGANGVILITTKKGTRGKVSLSYNATVSLDRYKSLTDWMDGSQWIDRWREALINGRNYQTTTNADLNVAPDSWYPDPFLDRTKMALAADLTALKSVWSGYEWQEYGVTPKMRATTPAEQALGWPAQVPVYNAKNIRSFNWQDAATRQGITQNHQIALSTGSEASRLYISLGYNNQQGVQRDQDFKRFNVNVNGEITATKWLTLGVSMIGSLSRQNYGISTNSGNTGSKDLYSRSIDQFPYALPRDSSGSFIRNPGGNLNIWNPLIDIDQSLNERRTASVLSNIFTEVKLAKGLRYRLNFGAQMRNYRTGAWTGPLATSHLNAVPNTAGYTREENFSWVAENLLYYDKTFSKNHLLGITLLQSAQQSRRENTAINVAGNISPSSLWYDLGSNSQGRPQGYSTGFTANALASFMGRVNYTFMNKYLLTASARYDGASVLAEGNKWELFPSFALAWKMQEEGFLKNVTWIRELKPRIGYGVTGNSSVPPYNTSGPLSRNPYVFGNTPAIGYLPQLARNPDLGWEKTAQWNAGADFSLFNSRISGAIELYQAHTSNLLLIRALNTISGYAEKYENVGKTRNRGIEITLSTVNIEKKNFSWSTDINFASNKEEIVELLNGKQDILASRLFIGQPTSVFYHYDNAGIWQDTKDDLAEMAKFNANGHKFYPGTIRVKDQNHDYRINADDYVVRGANRPKWSGGITNTFRYKNWLLSSFAYARIGQTYFGGYPNSYGGNTPNGRVEKDVWSFSNKGGKWPIALNGAQVDNFTPAMQFNDGSFVTIRNISLTYDMPASWLKRITVKSLQLNAQVLNPFIFGGEVVKWGINPDDDTNWESASQANSNSTAPLGGTNNNTILPQSFVLGLRASF